MAFQSVDEIDTFGFDDCTVNRMEIRENRISMELEALIVGVKNSQNTHYVRSYAGTTDVRLHGARLESAVREGFKMYNADNVLVKEEDDVPLSEADLQELLGNLAGAWLFRMDVRPNISMISTTLFLRTLIAASLGSRQAEMSIRVLRTVSE